MPPKRNPLNLNPLQLKTLTVTFNPNHGYAGSASSRAIARALRAIFPKR